MLVFRNRSMFQDINPKNTPKFKDNTVYRLESADYIDWKRFTTLLSSRTIQNTIAPLTSENRRNAFIMDDSILVRYNKLRLKLGAKFELIGIKD